MGENITKDALGEELKVGDEIVYKYEDGFSKGVITHIPQNTSEYLQFIVVYFYKRNRSWYEDGVKNGKRSRVQTANCVKIS